MTEPDVDLWQFCHSNYNEKVRWVLDLKGIPHRRHSLLPGPHRRVLKPLTGRSLTPTIRIGDGPAFDGSTAIIRALEARWPEPRLIPTDRTQRAEVLDIVNLLDEDLGVAARLGLLELALRRLRFAVRCYGADARRRVRLRYAAFFVLVRRVMRAHMGISAESGRLAREVVLEWLGRVAKRVAATGYIVGDQFTLADLTAASHLGLALGARPHTQPLPRGAPAPLEAWWRTCRATDGGRWALRIFAKHKPPHRASVIEAA